MKFYLAGRYRRRAELRGYAEELQALGHEVTARWLFEEPPEGVRDGGVALTGPEEVLRDLAARDIADVSNADVMLCFTEAPGTGGRGGRHVELGMAIMRSLNLIVIGPRENLFHYRADSCYPDWTSFHAIVLAR